MLLSLENLLRATLLAHLKKTYDLEPAQLAVAQPPQAAMGDFACPICFELARTLRRAPAKIAEEIVAQIVLPSAFNRIEVAGGGYLNVFLRRDFLWQQMVTASRDAGLQVQFPGKVIVEHTNINPNKAAHIGHLRNAVLGDTFVRLLRHRGEQVEVQNYIDNTGVQVADVVVGFEHLEPMPPAALAADIAALQRLRAEAIKAGHLSPPPHCVALAPEAPPRPTFSFDYRCWDLYARVSQTFEQRPESLAWRSSTLQAIEAGPDAPGTAGTTAQLGELVGTAVVHAHLATMQRINVRYDLLPRESEILHLHFWHTAFQLLKQSAAIRLESSGKNAGCWVMDKAGSGVEIETEPEAGDAKVIVRSNGTVTYVGKDIAYQLWKLGLLGREFQYQPFSTYPDGHTVWTTASTAASGAVPAPAFGKASAVFNVIDARQNYLQEVVVAGLRALGFDQAAEHSVHFSYEMVALTPRCAQELGYTLSTADAKRPYVQVSGRRGFGVKADDLLDRLIMNAWQQVAQRQPELAVAEQLDLGITIAVGALRYFLLKFTKSTVIAFDFAEALSFEGETGPYVQYAAVRAANILRKQSGELTAGNPASLLEDIALWELVRLAARLDAAVETAIISREPAHLARYAFQLAQEFNNFYHHHPVLTEANLERRATLLQLVAIVERQLNTALGLLGIGVPRAM